MLSKEIQLRRRNASINGRVPKNTELAYFVRMEGVMWVVIGVMLKS
jgi:hypothetical protein